MANLKAVDVDKLDADLTSVADAIRAKGETSGSLAFPDGFVSAVEGISSTEVVEPKIEAITIKENGVYQAEEGIDGYAPITVDIEIPEPTPPVIEALEVTESGTYKAPSGVDGFNPVVVDIEIPDPVITPITITENGEYIAPDGVDGHSPIKVEVSIPDPVLPVVEAITITENGTYNPPEGVDGYAPVTVEVEGEGGSLIDPSWTDFRYAFCYGRGTDEIVSKLKYSDTSNGTNFSYMFHNGTMTSIPLIDTSNGTSFEGMFGNCRKITTIPPIDTSNSTSLSLMFQQCAALTSVPPLDTSKCVGFSYMFNSDNKLITVSQLDVSNGTNFTSMFSGCGGLQNITFTGTIGASISFSNSSKLTLDSLKSIITALKDYAGTDNAGKYKLTLHATSKTNLEAEGATAPNGLTWIAFAESKGWNIA